MLSSQLANATFLPFASLAALVSATAVEAAGASSGSSTNPSLGVVSLPAQAQAIDSAKFASMPSVAPPSEYDGRTVSSSRRDGTTRHRPHANLRR